MKMLIERKDPFTGRTNTRDLDVTPKQVECWLAGELIQNVFPHLNADDREFIQTGIVWEDTFPEVPK